MKHFINSLLLILTLTILSVQILNAQHPDQYGMPASVEHIPLWDNDIPLNKPGISDERYEDERILSVSEPALYHYPVTVNEELSEESEVQIRPAILILPGGGYSRLAIRHEGILAAEWFSDRGFEAFILKYRLPDEEFVNHPEQVPLLDVQQAIHRIRSEAGDRNIDPERIGIIGFSAGGHLAASASTLFHSPADPERSPAQVRPDFSILLYPVITMDDRYTHSGSKQNLLGENHDSTMAERYSLERQVTKETPPTLIIHALDDRSVLPENSQLYTENLYQKNGDITQFMLPEGGHGFGFRANSVAAWWVSLMDAWLVNKGF